MNDGSHDFDFLHGVWDVAHHYRRAPDAAWQVKRKFIATGPNQLWVADLTSA